MWEVGPCSSPGVVVSGVGGVIWENTFPGFRQHLQALASWVAGPFQPSGLQLTHAQAWAAPCALGAPLWAPPASLAPWEFPLCRHPRCPTCPLGVSCSVIWSLGLARVLNHQPPASHGLGVLTPHWTGGTVCSGYIGAGYLFQALLPLPIPGNKLALHLWTQGSHVPPFPDPSHSNSSPSLAEIPVFLEVRFLGGGKIKLQAHQPGHDRDALNS